MALELPVGRPGRVLAAALLVLPAGLLWLVLAEPLLRLYAVRAEHIAERQTVLARMVTAAAALPELERAAAVAPKSADQPLLLAGDSDAVAAAALQSAVQQAANDNGAAVSSIAGLPAVEVGAGTRKYRRVGIKIELRSSHASLISMLAAIARATPPMIAEDIQIHGEAGPNDPRGAASPGSDASAAGAPDLLDVALSVFAFRGGAESTP